MVPPGRICAEPNRAWLPIKDDNLFWNLFVQKGLRRFQSLPMSCVFQSPRFAETWTIWKKPVPQNARMGAFFTLERPQNSRILKKNNQQIGKKSEQSRKKRPHLSRMA